jgi:hypothetical protein
LPAVTCRRLPAAGKSGKLTFLTGGKSATCRHPSAEAASSPEKFLHKRTIVAL